MPKGGSRYGAGRPGYKVTGESLHRVDVRLWARRNYLRGDNDCHFSWNWTCNGEPSGSIRVKANRHCVALCYRIRSFGGEWEDQEQYVEVCQTMCNFGGLRNWFRCPSCDRRCEVLYLRFNRFACRKCNRATYSSQIGGPLDRLSHKLHKHRKQIEGGRPKGMHRRTWDRLCERVNDLETEVDALFCQHALALFGDRLLA